jgi:DNA-directed RNA polymerase specialized sigma24 family protein
LTFFDVQISVLTARLHIRFLVQPLLHGLLSAARAILGNPRDAEEVAQESVLKALVNLRGFRAEAKFSVRLIETTIK